MEIFEDGERFPILFNKEDGMPEFMPTVYTISMVRNVGKAESTTMGHLLSIKFLKSWGMMHQIDIEDRYRKGDFLKPHEIEKLVNDATFRYDKLVMGISEGSPGGNRKKYRGTNRPAKLFKKRKSPRRNQCIRRTIDVRLCHIREYLDWLAVQRLSRVSERTPEFRELTQERDNIKELINAKKPISEPHYVKDPNFQMLGLTLEAEKALLAVIDPESPQNPWKQKHVRVRNQLILLLMLHTGIRRGESLGIRITDGDIDYLKNTLTIHRVPIDVSDPRNPKPQTKTRARILTIGSKIAQLARDYVLIGMQK